MFIAEHKVTWLRRPSSGASPAAPLSGTGQHEQVQAGEKLQGERGHRQQAEPIGVLALDHGYSVDDDGHRKGNGQPAVGLPNPFVPVQRGPPLTTSHKRSGHT